MSSAAQTVITGVLIVEIPVMTAAVWHWFVGLGGRITTVDKKINIIATRQSEEAISDTQRDKSLNELQRSHAADHDLIVEVSAWSERHEQWSQRQWDNHMRDFHHNLTNRSGRD